MEGGGRKSTQGQPTTKDSRAFRHASRVEHSRSGLPRIAVRLSGCNPALPLSTAKLSAHRNPRLAGVSPSTATGIRTPVSGLRIRRPSPLDDSGEGCDFSERRVRLEGVEPPRPCGHGDLKPPRGPASGTQRDRVSSRTWPIPRTTRHVPSRNVRESTRLRSNSKPST
jgi:hypothetical protein